MMGEGRKVIGSFVLASAFGAAMLSSAMLSSASLARPPDACLAAVNAAAQQAVEKTPWIGQATAVGRPFAVRPNVLRASVSLFGPQSAVFSVDVGIDPDCNVRSTSIELESNPWFRQ